MYGLVSCHVQNNCFTPTMSNGMSSNTTARPTVHTHTHPFNGPFSGTTWVSRYQKDQTNLDFTEARDSEWQWHQLGHMQVCTLLQIDNHASTQPLKFFYRLDALPATQPTALKHWRLADYTQSNSIHSSTEYTCKMQHRLRQLIWYANFTSISIVFYTRC